MYEEPNNHNKEILAFVAVLVIIVVIVGLVVLDGSKKDSVTTTAPSTNSTPATTTSASYKDGTYKATGSYGSPGGTESIYVSVTLKDGVITDSTTTSGANDRDAQMYQSMFINAYKQYVVGKKVNQISLGRVSGSSLTTQGFNDALAQIRNKAQS